MPVLARLIRAEMLDGPLAGNVRNERTARIQYRRAVHLPDCHVVRCVLPHDVRVAIAIEIAGELDGPLARHVGDKREVCVRYEGVNHSAPSGPTVMPVGKLSCPAIGNSVTTPAVVMRPILPKLSANHSARSGPVVMPLGLRSRGAGIP
jgi:hypothetical protein